MKKILVILPFLFVSCVPDSGTSYNYQSTPVVQEEAEDCDFDDLMEQDTDCGFPAKSKKTVKSTSVTRKVNVAPTRTYSSSPKSTYKPTTTYKSNSYSTSRSSTTRSTSRR